MLPYLNLRPKVSDEDKFLNFKLTTERVINLDSNSHKVKPLTFNSKI